MKTHIQFVVASSHIFGFRFNVSVERHSPMTDDLEKLCRLTYKAVLHALLKVSRGIKTLYHSEV